MWEWRFGYDAKRVKGLVDFQLYCDELAAEIGALPPLTHLFFSKPMIWWKIMFSSFTMHQYRLTGPYANPEVCEPVYAKSPAGDFLECSITAAFLITAKILSISLLLGLSIRPIGIDFVRIDSIRFYSLPFENTRLLGHTLVAPRHPLVEKSVTLHDRTC